MLLFTSDEKNFVQVQKENHKKISSFVKFRDYNCHAQKISSSVGILGIVSSVVDLVIQNFFLQGARVHVIIYNKVLNI